jgi:hypothetical protein
MREFVVFFLDKAFFDSYNIMYKYLALRIMKRGVVKPWQARNLKKAK